jgi:hypothetical protein
MPQPVGSTINMLLDLGLEPLVGALVFAVLIATLTAGAYSWLRRGKSDVTTILVALIVVANLACMVTSAGYIASRSRGLRLKDEPGPTRPFLNGQENGQVIVPRRFSSSAARWRQISSRGRAAARRLANSEEVAVPPE